MLWSAAPDGSATFINKRARDFSGISLEQAQNWGWLETIHPDERDDYANVFRSALLKGASFEAEIRIRRFDGVYRWHLNRAEPLRDAGGQIIQWFGVDIDIDDQKRAEERLRELRTNLSQTSRASVGAELSASIAHELNQPLTSMLVNAQAGARWLSSTPPNIQEAIKSVERVVRDGRAADAVTRNIRSLFRRQPVAKVQCNMLELIRDAVSLIKEDVNRRSTPIKLIYGEADYTVLADRFQIQQVIINLVGNAIEAMEEIDRPPLLQICIRCLVDGRVLSEFIDNGRGLPVESLDNIFNAFVTTKTNGMGIGLAISRSIVEAHEGELWAEKNQGFGAKFNLILKAPSSKM
jgi:PAS domain S-box-containing protein